MLTFHVFSYDMLHILCCCSSNLIQVKVVGLMNSGGGCTMCPCSVFLGEENCFFSIAAQPDHRFSS